MFPTSATRYLTTNRTISNKSKTNRNQKTVWANVKEEKSYLCIGRDFNVVSRDTSMFRITELTSNTGPIDGNDGFYH